MTENSPAMQRRAFVIRGFGTKKDSASVEPHSSFGLQFGREVHAVFESVGWVDEAQPDLPINDAGTLVKNSLPTST